MVNVEFAKKKKNQYTCGITSKSKINFLEVANEFLVDVIEESLSNTCSSL